MLSVNPGGTTHVVLLVEDDPGHQELARRALSCIDGGESSLRVAWDGEEAIDYLMRRGEYCDPEDSPTPDVVLLDLNMPRLDGRAVLERIRADRTLRNLPVVVLTTSDDERDIDRCYRSGCNCFITKPPDFDEFRDCLVSAVSHCLSL